MSRRTRGPEPRAVDVHVGRRMRALRREARISLEALAAEIGITYQQVQKYECGSNRVSASALYDIAVALRAPVEAFFVGLPVPAEAADAHRRDRARLDALMAATGGMELLEAFLATPARLRRPLVELARGLAGLEGPAGGLSAWR